MNYKKCISFHKNYIEKLYSMIIIIYYLLFIMTPFFIINIFFPSDTIDTASF